MIILDNMTLQGAARALSRYQPDLDRSLAAHHRNTGKWDFGYSDDLRLTADVLALAQLVESVILFDEIGVGPYGTPSWAKTRDCDGVPLEAPEELDGLSGLLTVLDRGYDHASLIVETTLRAQEHARTDDFRDYIRTLEEHDALGAYLQISNGYISTGFSDDILCGDAANQTISHLISNEKIYRRAELAGLLTGLLKGRVWRRGHQGVVNLLVGLNKAVGHELKMRYHADVDTTLYPFDLTRPGVTDVPAKANAGIDLVRNAAAAYYYDRLAAHAGVAYAPHPLRAPFVEYRPSGELGPVEVVRRMEERRAENVHLAKRTIAGTFRGGENIVEVRLPLFLATVLAESAEPEDVIAQALHLRDSSPARRLRAWFAETGELSRSGDLGVDRLAVRVQKLEKELDTWWSPGSRRPGRKIAIGLTVGPATIQAQDISLPLLRFGRRRPRTFRLLYDLAQISRDNLSLAPQLGRVLGVDAANAWRRCAEVFERIKTGTAERAINN
jgi:hypothetical protein